MQRKTLVLILLSSLGVFSGSLLAPIEARFLQMVVHDTFLIGIVFAVGTIFTSSFTVVAFIIGYLLFLKKKQSF